MCGLSAYISPNNFQDELKQSTDLMAHRGPDGEGFYFNNDSSLKVGFGHRRLSIIDLSEKGSQPMLKDDVAITFVGEIYNFKELRQYCIDKGCKFFSNTDTEVILSLYSILGKNSFSLLKGMYSFILHDSAHQKVYAIRDRMGIKPLYFFEHNNTILFSSEIKGFTPFKLFKKEICRESLFEFLTNGFVYEPRTGFKNVFKVGHGEIFEIDISQEKLTYNKTYLDDPRILINLNDNLIKSIKTQTNADVKTGIFFSGGTDSSVIASSAKLPLVFANYEYLENNLDKNYAIKISEALNQKIKVIDFKSDIYKSDSLINYVNFVAEHTEEMICDYTFHSTYELSTNVRKEGYKVMLSGAGGDETFAGYPRYLAVKYKNLLAILIKPIKILSKFEFINKKYGKKIHRLISFLGEENILLAYSRLVGVFSRHQLKSFFYDFEEKEKSLLLRYENIIGDEFESPNLKKTIKLDKYGFLQHNLMVADKASMLAGVEIRVPLLDEDLYKTTYHMSSYEIMGFFNLKKILKNFLKSFLPRNLIYRKKIGFNPPIESLLLDLKPENILDMLSPLDRYINTSTVKVIINDHFNLNADNTYQIWQLIYLASWLKIHLED